MKQYIISRAVLSLLVAVLFTLFGFPWWGAVLIGALIFALFVGLPRTGRYLVRPEKGMTALRRDERTREINLQAGLNAFVATNLGLFLLMLFYRYFAPGDVPVSMLNLPLLLGVATYFATDFWLRRV